MCFGKRLAKELLQVSPAVREILRNPGQCEIIARDLNMSREEFQKELGALYQQERKEFIDHQHITPVSG